MYGNWTNFSRGVPLQSQRWHILDRAPTQRYCCVILPAADSTTGYLPPGIHKACWDEIAPRFAVNGHRSRLIEGLLTALLNLAGAGCRLVLLDGSFVSQKELPQDYDGAWDTVGVDPSRLPVLLDFSNGRAAMKSKYLGELFPATAMGPPLVCPTATSS
jgi:hypothetical protein